MDRIEKEAIKHSGIFSISTFNSTIEMIVDMCGCDENTIENRSTCIYPYAQHPWGELQAFHKNEMGYHYISYNISLSVYKPVTVQDIDNEIQEANRRGYDVWYDGKSLNWKTKGVDIYV